MVVRWEHFGDRPAPLSEDVIRGAELLLGIRFPADYRQCVRLNHGACPSPDEFVVARDGQTWRGALGALLTLDPRAADGLFRALASLGGEHELPPEIIPIAADGGGDLVCLDYRDDPHGSAPRVVYWHHEARGVDGLTTVAASFSELLAMLQPPEEDA